MKQYVKPSIEVTTLASSTPIAVSPCDAADYPNGWDEITKYVDNAKGDGNTCTNYVWRYGSN